MSIVFYTAPWSSASPVASALHELGVPHETVTFDLTKTEHKKADFLAINPNGKVPTITVDGAPMFEALAILTWLGETYGVSKKLWPEAGTPERLQAASWSAWSYVSYAAALGFLALATSERVPQALHNPAQADHARNLLNGMLSVLDARLAKNKYILGAKYSLADLIVGSVVGYGVMVGQPVEAHPHVKAWLAEFQKREAFQVGMKPKA
ncbi:MAG TPA: glutathione S-transferase family protein [Polyangiaceae bacterium]|nr:glutathione S-transferase family protein [Polyangiaceae bacterium]